MTGRKRLGYKVRLVPSVELIAEIFNVPLDRAGSYPELDGALLRRETARDALQHLALAIRQGDKIFLLARKIHHASPEVGNSLLERPIGLDITGLQLIECAVPESDIPQPANARTA